MYKYSPIKKIYVKNFRNIGEAIIDFEESPIVSLIGENEAGKTSIVKAFSVCALHSTPRDQKDFIRDGTGGFGVAIELEDGTLVTRMKTPSLNKYSVKKADGTVWDANKIDSGLPAAVQEVMGLIEEPETKEYLQVRTYEDQLLFVVTPASTNYKVMYDALKVDQLTKAIKLGSNEANTLKSEISSNELGISTLTNNLRNIRTYDITPLLNIKARLVKELREVERLEQASKLLDTINSKKLQLGALGELYSSGITEINEGEASRIATINRLLYNIENIKKKLTSISVIDTAEYIDMTVYDKLVNIFNRQSEIADTKAKIGALADIGKASEVSMVEADHLYKVAELISTIELKQARLSIIEPHGADLIEQKDFDAVLKAESIIQRLDRNNSLQESVKKIDDYCKQVEDYLKNIGAAVEICPNCGESVVIDIEKYA